MKRSQPGSKSCYSGEGVISRTRPLDGGGKAVSKGRVLFLRSSTTSSSGGRCDSGGGADLNTCNFRMRFPSMREYNAIEKLWWYYGIAFHCLIQLPLSYHRTRALSTARLQRAWRLAPTHFFHKIRASLYVRNLMFARLIFACCADIKPRVQTFSTNMGFALNH